MNKHLKVNVQDSEGNLLTPTTPGKARKLLRNEKAEVVCKNPFSIRLLNKTCANNVNQQNAS